MTSSVAGPEIVLDLSRLLSRILHRTPTGVDRVEMAYARGLLALAPGRLAFGAVHPCGLYGRIPEGVVRRFLDAVSTRWASVDARESASGRYTRVVSEVWSMRPRPVPPSSRARVFLQSSPNHLVDVRVNRAILRRERARFACLLHDFIPVTHPEYARPGGDQLHLRRIRTVAELACAVIANSHATLNDFTPYLRESGRPIDTLVAHLGIDELRRPLPIPEQGVRPYFVCLGTIEPRKNHLLLLHIWRALAERHGPHTIPKLIIVGRRGWENEQIVDMLDRCHALGEYVEERSHLRDDEVQALVAGARALLLPSFAEGFGMPVPEALALGTPVICSDLPALREAGGEAPDYLDPLDGPAWCRQILDYAAQGSPLRAAQINRIAHWSPTTWQDHLAKVMNLLHRLDG